MLLLFYYAVWVGHSFFSKEQASFNSMAAVIISSDFGENKIKSVIVSIVSPYICHDAGRDWGQVEKGMTEDEMAAWHH